ncbi:organoarsenical effux MFS transporter ArsJ [Shewanella schlegeliana]|uniref:Organoarsenical effux MFS transporter ArsJ n=1 Tax=Shewanella schlegeliana TaxID=190308 RepID=A0ABS1SX60_9GAMM|nr:organoarsenical effux MFS transporter ArsJ [Shewanella schlegeliana]MBL4912984.1 organoarsenical effux MFS transporter ArsJ [Shewanella schlegeliana]MCL1108920.1 organoarsenical effux MFS transporter ArsJ [Shewanella schlegeliana]GIU23681.1 MFS transporter [Shewanella schlegeliana]
MLTKYRSLPDSVKQYLIVTGNYWAFTLTDGALRMLVVLHFYDLGYTPLAIAMLFLFYEIFGVITNLVGGWLGARLGLNKTMNIGLGLQIIALSMLLLPAAMLTVPWVMAAQALSGIAKDLNKMSAKSAIKTLVPKDAEDKLYRWVAILTGSKNALKGAGFFLGGLLLSLAGFSGAVAIMAVMLLIVWLGSMLSLKADLGKAKSKPKFTQIFSKSDNVNILSAARLFLFAARDVWFVIALPVFLASQLGWEHSSVGAFLALWVIAYGMVQSIAPSFTARKQAPDGKVATLWVGLLALITAILAVLIFTGWVAPQLALIIGLMVFGAVFAINSSLHSYLIVSYACEDGVSLDIGFYYMANAMGRLLGTVLSGWVYQEAGLSACLFISAAMLFITFVISYKLPRNQTLTSY